MNDLVAMLPFVLLAGGALLVAPLSVVVRADGRAWSVLGAVIASGAAIAAALLGGGPEGLGGAIRRDGASAFFAVVVSGCTAVALVLALDERGHRARSAELAVLTLVATSGAVLLSAGSDLVVLLVGLTLVSVPAYLASARPGGRRLDARVTLRILRGALGPVVFGAGMTLVYVSEGALAVGTLGDLSSTVGVAGLALLVAGLSFAAAFVPLQVAAARGADVPTFVIVALTMAASAGAVAATARIGGAITASDVAALDWRACLAVLASAALVLGTLIALGETSLRRLVAYASVVQVGYVAVALAAGTAAAPAAAFALVLYAALIIGALGVIALLPGDEPRRDELQGLARRRPLVASAFAIILLGLAGLPPTGGFFARAYIFEAAIGARLAWLVILGAFCTVASAVYCLRVLFACLGDIGPGRAREAAITSSVVLIAAFVVLLIGIVPGPLLDAVENVRF